jgi:Ca2+-binding EF-hand superfamily protein
MSSSRQSIAVVRPDATNRPSSASPSRPTSAVSQPVSNGNSRPTSATSDTRRNALMAGSAGSTSAAEIGKRRTMNAGGARTGTAAAPGVTGAGPIIKLGGARGKHNMTEEMKKEYTETFNVLDDLHEGSIAAPKLLLAMKILGFAPTAAATERSNGDQLDLNEYMSFVLSCSSSQTEWCLPEMHETFSLFDRENCGYIAAAQFKRTFGRLGEKLTDIEIEDQMDDFDLNNEFNLELNNYYKMLLSNENR